jgi:DNA-binding NtrC family response regulator
MSIRASGDKTILVVDDDEGVRQIFARMLTLEGYQVRTAMNAKSGLRVVAQSEPDAIILDLRMPQGAVWNFFGGFVQAIRTARRRWRSSPATTSAMTTCPLN